MDGDRDGDRDVIQYISSPTEQGSILDLLSDAMGKSMQFVSFLVCGMVQHLSPLLSSPLIFSLI